MFKKIMAVALTAVMALSVLPFVSIAGDKKSKKIDGELKFNDDGKFTILNFSDIQDTYPLMGITKDLIKDTLEIVKPDLIILTGDNIAGYSAHTKPVAKKAINEFMEIFEKKGIRVAQVFGNHDDEDTLATKDFQMDCYESYDCFIGKRGEEMTGLGTYNLPIKSSDGTYNAFNLWFTDSGTYNTENDKGGYGCVGKDQIQWYIKTSNELKAANGGKSVPSMNFQHIIVPEIYEALVRTQNGFELPAGSTGELNENPCPPQYSNGQFAAFLAQGDVIATVCGHDHINNFVVPYKGIDIINTPGTGFRSYDGLVVGSRVFVLDENAPEDYETYCLSYFDVYGKDDKAAELRFNIHSDTTDSLTKFTSFFKYIFVRIGEVFQSK